MTSMGSSQQKWPDKKELLNGICAVLESQLPANKRPAIFSRDTSMETLFSGVPRDMKSRIYQRWEEQFHVSIDQNQHGTLGSLVDEIYQKQRGQQSSSTSSQQPGSQSEQQGLKTRTQGQDQ